MSKHPKTPAAVAIGAAIAGLALGGSAFAMQPLAQGYMLGASIDGHGGDKAAEGKCGMEHMDADKDGRISKAEFAAAHEGKADRFDAHDPDGDGFVTAKEMKAHHAAKAAARGGEAADHSDKATTEGKCGAGKCGAERSQAATGPAAATNATAATDAATDAGDKADKTDKAAMEGKCGEGKCGGM